MTPKPTSPPRSRSQPSLPRDHDREGGQPYATEVEDYKHGVTAPLEEQGRREANPSGLNLTLGTHLGQHKPPRKRSSAEGVGCQ